MVTRWLRRKGAPRALGGAHMRKRYSAREFSEWIEGLMVARVDLTEPGPKNRKCLLAEEMDLGREAVVRRERRLPPLVVMPRAGSSPQEESEPVGGEEESPSALSSY